MKSVIFRQPREAAILYASTEEDLHKELLDRKRKRRYFLLTSLLFILSAILTLTFLYFIRRQWTETKHTASFSPDAVQMQGTLAEHIIRLHIRAASDDAGDQAIKLLVRDQVIAYLSEAMQGVESKEQAEQFLLTHLPEITRTADEALKQAGVSYTAEALYTKADFPLKVYDDIFLPAGEYDALQINLGGGSGQNWWCIVFPALCLTDSVTVVPNSPQATVEDAPLLYSDVELPTKQEFRLGRLLGEPEYEAIRTQNVKVEFRFRLLDLLRGD